MQIGKAPLPRIPSPRLDREEKPGVILYAQFPRLFRHRRRQEKRPQVFPTDIAATAHKIQWRKLSVDRHFGNPLNRTGLFTEFSRMRGKFSGNLLEKYCNNNCVKFRCPFGSKSSRNKSKQSLIVSSSPVIVYTRSYQIVKSIVANSQKLKRT